MNDKNQQIPEKQVENRSNNPEGKGGFQDHPELINKNGRPPRGWAWADLIDEASEELIDLKDEKTGEVKATISVKKAVIKKLIQLALKGDITAIREVFDRTEGKPVQRLAGANGNALEVLFDKLERTDYGRYSKEIVEQNVANATPVQDTGQNGGTDNLQAE